MIPLGPPLSVAAATVTLLTRSTKQPSVPVPVQSCVRPKKKKSVPTPTGRLGLKNSVQPVHWAAVEVSSCWENEVVLFIVAPVNPKEYSHGLVSPEPVPQTKMFPPEGPLKYWLSNAGSSILSPTTPPEEPCPRLTFTRVAVERVLVSTCTRTAEVPLLALAAKVFPLVISTTGAARIPGVLAPALPIASGKKAEGLVVLT